MKPEKKLEELKKRRSELGNKTLVQLTMDEVKEFIKIDSEIEKTERKAERKIEKFGE